MKGFIKQDYLIVTRRLPGETNDIREFVRPNDFAVRQLYESHRYNGAVPQDKVVDLFTWVCENINYPKDKSLSRHISFDGYSADINDYWPFPTETLAWPRVGDCDSGSHLLVSLIRNFAPPEDVYVVLGAHKSNRMNHAWVEWKDMILETTKDIPPERVFEMARDYEPMVRYNDKEIWVKEGNRDYLSLKDPVPAPERTNRTVVRTTPDHQLMGRREYPQAYTYRGDIDLLEVNIASVSDQGALFAAVEEAAKKEGYTLLKQELYHNATGKHPWLLEVSMVADSKNLSIGILPLIPIVLAITAVAGAIGVWQLSRIVQAVPAAGILLPLLGLAIVGGVVYWVIKKK